MPHPAASSTQSSMYNATYHNPGASGPEPVHRQCKHDFVRIVEPLYYEKYGATARLREEINAVKPLVRSL